MLTTPSAAADPAARADLDHLQGAWRSVAGRRAATFVVAGDRYTFAFLDGDTYTGTLHLDAGADPRQMDMTIDDGPPVHKGHLALCIYDLNEDVLRWCPTVPGAGYRLSRFPSVHDDHYYSLVFHRDNPPRRSR
jgi:uncharacterized protein (TIGR03067 family)